MPYNLPTTITAFRTGDVIPVDGPSGTAKMAKDDLLKETAQNALADNVAEAFDESGATTYKAGKAIVRGGKTYVFKVDHSGAWSASDVQLSYINDCGVIDNGGIGNANDLYKVKTRILHFDVTKPIIVNVTKPLRASGNYYKVGYQLVTNDAIIGRYSVSGSYPFSTFVLSADGVRAGTQFTIGSTAHQACKGIALEIQEYDSLGNEVANRKEDFVGYSVQLIQPCEPYQVFFNGGIDNPYNANKIHSKIIPVAGGYKYVINLSKQVKNSGGYFKIGYILTSNASDIGKNAADVYSGGSYITIVSASGSRGLRIDKLLDLSSYVGAVGIGFELDEFDSTNTEVANRFNDFYGQTLSLVPYHEDKTPMYWGNIPDGGTLAYIDGASGGHLKWSYLSQEYTPGVMNVGTAMASFTHTTGTQFRHIDYIQSPTSNKFPFIMETDGTRHRIVNVSGHSVQISTIFCFGWQYPDNWNAPTGWVSGSAVEEGAINNLFNKTREASVDLSPLNAIARINVASDDSKDFCALIVTDSHGDNSSVTRAIDYSGKAIAVSATLHCGDYVTDAVSYGQTTSNWSPVVAKSTKPTYFVQGNHEKGTYKNIALTPSDSMLYNLFVEPIVAKGYLSVGEYEMNKCYYYHDFTALKTRLIVLDEYRAPTDYDETYWEAITYDSSLPDVANNTDYSIGDKVNVPNFTANSFQAVQAVNTGAYYSGKHPCYRCIRGYRYIDQTEAQWFLDTLYSTPSDYVVVVAMHNPFSDLAVLDKSKKFCQQVSIPDNVSGAYWAMNYMATDFVADALNAFKTGASYSATVATKSNSEAAYISDYSVAKDFSVRGEGKVGLILGGHAHRDLVWKHPTYTYMYQVAPMCSKTTGSAFNKNADIRLQNDSRYEDYVDSLTAFAVADGRVALAKIGCKYTTDANVRDIEIL